VQVWRQGAPLGVSRLEAILVNRLERAGLPPPVREYRFHPRRRWRFDFAWLDQKIALEIEGGGFVEGRHHRGAGFAADCSKYAEALILGWRVLRITPRMIDNGAALDYLGRLFANELGGRLGAPDPRQ